MTVPPNCRRSSTANDSSMLTSPLSSRRSTRLQAPSFLPQQPITIPWRLSEMPYRLHSAYLLLVSTGTRRARSAPTSSSAKIYMHSLRVMCCSASMAPTTNIAPLVRAACFILGLTLISIPALPKKEVVVMGNHAFQTCRRMHTNTCSHTAISVKAGQLQVG